MKIDKDLKDKLNYLFDIFDKNNLLEVNVNFYGSGDDGNMELGHALLRSEDKKIRYADDLNWDEPTIFNDSLHELLLDVSDFLLDKKCIDYRNGNGNQGNITYTVKDKNVFMSYLVTEDAEYEFSL